MLPKIIYQYNKYCKVICLKDYYDIYYFANIEWNKIDKNILKQAVNTTFEHRDSKYELENNSRIIDELAVSESLKLLWQQFTQKHSYAKKTSFDETIQAIKFIFKEIYD